MTKQELQTMVGRNLRRARLEQQMTIDQVAERAGISTTFYSNLECGNKMMSLLTFQKLTEVLCISADDLLKEDAVPEPSEKIERLVRGQSPGVQAFLEKLLRLCADELPLVPGQEDQTG